MGSLSRGNSLPALIDRVLSTTGAPPLPSDARRGGASSRPLAAPAAATELACAPPAPRSLRCGNRRTGTDRLASCSELQCRAELPLRVLASFAACRPVSRSRSVCLRRVVHDASDERVRSRAHEMSRGVPDASDVGVALRQPCGRHPPSLGANSCTRRRRVEHLPDKPVKPVQRLTQRRDGLGQRAGPPDRTKRRAEGPVLLAC